FFFFQAEDGIRDFHVTGVQTCALPILAGHAPYLSLDVEFFLEQGGGCQRLFEYGAAGQQAHIRLRHILHAIHAAPYAFFAAFRRSEERRLGKEGRWVGWRSQEGKKKKT